VDAQIPTELNWEQFLCNKLIESYPGRQVPIEAFPDIVWDQTILFASSLGQ